ncbi:MAG TPA: hypothetical protein VGX50_07820, partial [Longimicrobium sp.]|nr:hypothetical protein [Longimicrobium sp.]
ERRMSHATRTPPLDTEAEKDDIAPEVSAHFDAILDGVARWQVPAGDPGQGVALTLMAISGGALALTVAAVAAGRQVPADGARSLSTGWWAFAATAVAAGMAAMLGGGVQRYPQTLFRTMRRIIQRADAGHPVDLSAEAGRAERHLMGAIDILLRLQRAMLLAAWAAFIVGLLSLIGFGSSLLPSVT